MADRLKWEGGDRAGSPLGTIYYYILQLVFKVFCAEDIFLNVLVLLEILDGRYNISSYDLSWSYEDVSEYYQMEE